MATKTILLAVADPQALVEITQALGAQWQVTSVACEADGIEKVEKCSFDALLADFNLGSPDDASELLNQALEKRPETIRFLLAYEADLALVAAKVVGPCQILPKPIDAASLKDRIENELIPIDSTGGESSNEVAGDLISSPGLAAAYADVLKAFEAPGVTSEQLAEVLSAHPALMAEVVRLTNSTRLGLDANITEPVQAVESLGPETVKVLVTALKYLAEHSQLNPGYLSFEKIWQHSTKVAQLARDLVFLETEDRALAAEAFTAGLVHDLGKVVLVENFDSLYARVHSLARKQPVTLWDIEKEMFGASHGQIGGCLVGMWNLPAPVVDAVAFHHEPPLGENQRLTPLAAVHVANVLAHECWPDDEGMRVAPIISTPFLNEIGLLERLPVWRAALNGGSVTRSAEVEFAEANLSDSMAAAVSPTPATQSANYVPAPTTPTRTSTSREPSRGGHRPELSPARYWQRQWLYAGIVATLTLLALWFGTQFDFEQTMPVSARTAAPAKAPVAASWTQVAQPAPADVPQTAPEPAPASPAPKGPQVAAADPPQVASAAPVSEKSTTTTAPAATQAVASPAKPEPAQAPAAAMATPVATTPAASAPAVTTPAVSVPVVTTVAAVATPAGPTVPAATAPTVTAPASAPAATAPRSPTPPKPDFRLNGIIFSTTHPTAFINGHSVSEGDQVNGATVMSIGRTSVTLQVNGQTRTLTLPAK